MFTSKLASNATRVARLAVNSATLNRTLSVAHAVRNRNDDIQKNFVDNAKRLFANGIYEKPIKGPFPIDHTTAMTAVCRMVDHVNDHNHPLWHPLNSKFSNAMSGSVEHLSQIVNICVSKSNGAILTGPSGQGKSSLLRYGAHLVGHLVENVDSSYVDLNKMAWYDRSEFSNRLSNTKHSEGKTTVLFLDNFPTDKKILNKLNTALIDRNDLVVFLAFKWDDFGVSSAKHTCPQLVGKLGEMPVVLPRTNQDYEFFFTTNRMSRAAFLGLHRHHINPCRIGLPLSLYFVQGIGCALPCMVILHLLDVHAAFAPLTIGFINGIIATSIISKQEAIRDALIDEINRSPISQDELSACASYAEGNISKLEKLVRAKKL